MLQAVPVSDLLLILMVALALLGAVILLRRRRRPAGTCETEAAPLSSSERIPKATFYILRLAGFALLCLVVIGGSVILYRDYQLVSVESAPTPSQVKIPEDLPFDVQKVSFPSQAGLVIKGWFVPGEKKATIILLHGYGGNRSQMIWHAQQLNEAGYGALMYDERASGESQGEYRSYGWEDSADVGAALRYLESLPEVDAGKIGIAGCSIGGQIALQGAAAYPQIGAVWADGPAVVRAIDNPPPENWATALGYSSNFVLDWMYTWRLGVEAPAPMIEQLGDIAPRPILLVGGGRRHPYFGNEAPQVERYAAYAGENADVWIIEEAYHCDGPQRRPQEYAGRMVEFFNSGLGIE